MVRTARDSGRLVAGCAALLCGLSLGGASAQAQLPFFPGAEGYGGAFSGVAPAAGWLSNATVYHVTNLNDDGAGSFRGAFTQNSANKIIVFDVAGTINIGANVDIKNLSNYYIAGQTAPGPVTIYGNTVQLTHSGGKENRNVVLRYLSFRKGDADGSDTITFAGGGLGTNLILDHVSASWSEDEVLSVANNNTNVTVQYSMINDALVSGHAYGSLIRPRISSEVTFHHNLYANNASRQARFGTYNGETLTADFRNNVVYNFRDRASYTGGSSEDDQEQTDVNYVGNYIVAGPGTQAAGNIAYSVDKNVDTRVFQSGNFIDPDEAPGGAPADGVLDGADTGWGMFTVNNPTDQTFTQMASPFDTPAVATQSAPDAYAQVRDYVGNWWWNRDAIDSRVIGNLVNFTGPPIGASGPNAGELSALLAAPQVNHPAGYDTDGDAMPDAWETAHGLNPNLASDWNLDFDNDGYINLLEFINEKGEFPAPTPIVFDGAASGRYADIMNWRTDDGGVTDGSNWQPSRFDAAVIHSGAVVVDSVGQHAGALLIAPDSSDNASLSITAGWLMVDQRIEVGSSSGVGRLTLTPGGMLVAPVTEIGASGELTGEGELIGDLVNGGLVSPGDSPGILMVDGDYTQTAGGRLLMELSSESVFDHLLVEGAVSTDGALEVVLLEGYTPSEGAVFDLLDWVGAKSGAFQSLLLPSLPASLAWDVSLLESHGVLSVAAAAPLLAGDYNNDGAVDAADYAVWRDNLGAPAGTLQNDPNSSAIGQAQYDTWKANFGLPAGSGQGSAANTPVPEPSAGILLMMGVALGCTAGLSLSRGRRAR
ncbi:hypothetical protein [Pirellulimonas nuda]|uniref:hypothetical protein n=1 Tax=Pirellulimonas nuda TaxID=2528009 RepID=UPI0011A3997A|nr:hypothetical protein [Pirellulimonas nuda]